MHIVDLIMTVKDGAGKKLEFQPSAIARMYILGDNLRMEHIDLNCYKLIYNYTFIIIKRVHKPSSNLVRVAPDCNRSYCEDSFSGYSGSV